MGTPKKLLNMVRLSGDNFDLIRCRLFMNQYEAEKLKKLTYT